MRQTKTHCLLHLPTNLIQIKRIPALDPFISAHIYLVGFCASLHILECYWARCFFWLTLIRGGLFLPSSLLWGYCVEKRSIGPNLAPASRLYILPVAWKVACGESRKAVSVLSTFLSIRRVCVCSEMPSREYTQSCRAIRVESRLDCVRKAAARGGGVWYQRH